MKLKLGSLKMLISVELRNIDKFTSIGYSNKSVNSDQGS